MGGEKRSEESARYRIPAVLRETLLKTSHQKMHEFGIILQWKLEGGIVDYVTLMSFFTPISSPKSLFIRALMKSANVENMPCMSEQENASAV